MLFNSLHFLFFYPIVSGLYFFVPARWASALLLAASYYFYMCSGPLYALLLFFVTIVSFSAGLVFGRHGSNKERKRRILWFTTLALISVLVLYKYCDFLADSLEDILSVLGLRIPLGRLHLLLPVGLSFYTFQALSYVVDVFRGDKTPERNFGIYALYVSFFPQLVAGPIERSTRLLPQLKLRHGFHYTRVRNGLLFMLCGFFKKVVVADRCAPIVDKVFSSPGDYSGLSLLIAAYLFALQIYCDFSGYTDIALGSAKVIGFDLMENFDRPYVARSITEFWNRWHISLYTWFRDYIYIPLGGNRVSQTRAYFNILVVFFLSGLWHGAAYTFIVWGVLHGLCVVVSRSTSEFRNRVIAGLGLGINSRFRQVFATLLTFHLVTALWIVFRSKTVDEALFFFNRIGTTLELHLPSNLGSVVDLSILSLLSLIIASEHIFGLTKWRLISPATNSSVRWIASSALLWMVVFLGVFNNTQFIYFVF